MGQYISSDELNSFKAIPKKAIIECMETYLIGINGCTYNMEETGERIFRKKNSSYTVSLIHRCYNFSNQNKGRYRNGCAFEREYHYRVSRDDIEAFVKKYPHGCFDTDITFEDFLLTRIQNQSAKSGCYPPDYNYTEDLDYNSQNNLPNTSSGSSDSDDLFPVLGFVGIIILIIMLLTGNLFKHWIISLIILFFSIGCLSALDSNNKDT